MSPRKAIYTPEEAKARAEEQKAQYKERNEYVSMKITLPARDKAIYAAYAEWKGLPVARMFRQCAEACMRLDGWTYQHEAEQEAGKEDQAGADQAGEQAEEQAQ